MLDVGCWMFSICFLLISAHAAASPAGPRADDDDVGGLIHDAEKGCIEETSNIQHRTTNNQCRACEDRETLDVRCWMLVVGCFPFSSRRDAPAERVVFVEQLRRFCVHKCRPGD